MPTAQKKILFFYKGKHSGGGQLFPFCCCHSPPAPAERCKVRPVLAHDARRAAFVTCHWSKFLRCLCTNPPPPLFSLVSTLYGTSQGSIKSLLTTRKVATTWPSGSAITLIFPPLSWVSVFQLGHILLHFFFLLHAWYSRPYLQKSTDDRRESVEVFSVHIFLFSLLCTTKDTRVSSCLSLNPLFGVVFLFLGRNWVRRKTTTTTTE